MKDPQICLKCLYLADGFLGAKRDKDGGHLPILYTDFYRISVSQESMHWIEARSRHLLPLQTFNPASLLSPTCTSTLSAALYFHFQSLSESRVGTIARNSHLISILLSKIPLLQLLFFFNNKVDFSYIQLPLILIVFVSLPLSCVIFVRFRS